MIAWEWNIEKAREEEESEKKKATSRKISQTAQVCSRLTAQIFNKVVCCAVECVIFLF